MRLNLIIGLLAISALVVGCSSKTPTVTHNTSTGQVRSTSVNTTAASNQTITNTSNTVPSVPVISAPKQTVTTLVAFNDSGDGVTLEVPEGWKRVNTATATVGGYTIFNPRNPYEKILVGLSGCVGCYYQNGAPNPDLVVPATATHVFDFNNGLSAGYELTSQKIHTQGTELLL